MGSADRAPSLRVIPWHLPYNRVKSTGNFRVIEKCPDIPVAGVQYTFTHKQYTEHHETEYTERNIHNNKNT
jgi:hypothetical protein